MLVDRHRIRLPSRLKTQRLGVGNVNISYLIIDDFYDDPYAVRNAALHTDYTRLPVRTNYPGDNSDNSFEIEGLSEIVSRLVHEPVMATPNSAHCRFRIATAGAESQSKLNVHVDRANHWSGLVYLSLPEHCRGGTDFYQHKELGSDRAPLKDSEVAQFGSQNCALFTMDLVEKDSNDPSNWEHLFTVPMRFNRCVIFRPWFWHSPGNSFGDRRENARLVQMFFFTRDKSKPHESGPAS